jgi:hypothetical protein
MIFFAKTDNLEILNKAVLYVRDNELTNCFRVVHVYESEEKIPPHMSEYVNVLDKMYPKIKIDLVRCLQHKNKRHSLGSSFFCVDVGERYLLSCDCSGDCEGS